MEPASTITIVSPGEYMTPDLQDFVGIVILLLIKSATGLHKERNTGNAAKALMNSLRIKASVERNGFWKEIESVDLRLSEHLTWRFRSHVIRKSKFTQ